ncbi:MAG: GNAT family N-acetyltransferase [Chloroflexi bacterium]|nr:GNAT family N-acetyltransferase [Chloroflexota bacterium]
MTRSILYQSTKYDGSVNYRWQAQLEYENSHLIILYTPPNTPYSGRRSGILRYPFRSYFWTDRWYNVNQTFLGQDHAELRHYINLGTPAVYQDGAVSFVDLDLDFDMDNRWNLTLLDEDEYAAHSRQFAYPRPIRHRVDEAVQEIRRRVRERAWPFASGLQGPRIRIRPFYWSDLERMDAWQGSYGPFDDPWLIPSPGTSERHYWFANYLDAPICRLYAIEQLDGELIGHLSLREITRGSQARLGIGFAPLAVGQGFGTETLQTFLPYYFEVLGFERMVLDVAASNQRAVRVYQKIGFRPSGEHFRGTDDEVYQWLEDGPHFASLRRFFRRTGWGFQQLHYDMELSHQNWQQQAAVQNQMPNRP